MWNSDPPSHPISCLVRLRNWCWRLMLKSHEFWTWCDALELAATNSVKTVFWALAKVPGIFERTPKSACFSVSQRELTQFGPLWPLITLDLSWKDGFPPLHPWPVADRHRGAGSIVPADHHATWVWTDSKSLASKTWQVKVRTQGFIELLQRQCIESGSITISVIIINWYNTRNI